MIGDVPPIGLCGSGLLDAVAQLRLSGLLLPSGRFVKAEDATHMVVPDLAKRIITGDQGRRSFVLAWPEKSGGDKPIVLTQRDVRELQFAKGSIAGGIDVVMQELGVEADELVEIFLAGSFGSYINPQSARIIGLVPPVPVERIKAVGNAAFYSVAATAELARKAAENVVTVLRGEVPKTLVNAEVLDQENCRLST